ncbi:hypothetical protein SSABA_v1c02210 [Spiroplasma sabaudiense Ar-1343]|uniref:Transmembrane protein n=1 Tax=Spiroplasma sabaudiense Ar-1343 TaxID=1276257 RepID=W6A910_9MOLU|nr:energy-coupled thiamine transporter ThiT [Spiroplasma sabaudiense]AHI53633.1 hypothetical protein SSABA_v1c02210 [Spiroplasma sabaudiense Ar-1343]
MLELNNDSLSPKLKIFKPGDLIWTFFCSLALIGASLTISTIVGIKTQKLFGNPIKGEFILILMVMILLNLFLLHNVIIKTIIVLKFEHSYKAQLLYFSVLTFDFVIFARLLILDPKKTRLLSLRIYKWVIFDYIFIAMTFALYFCLGFIASLIPQLPFFITITIKFIPLFFLAYLCDWVKVFFCSILCGGFEWLFPGTFIVSVPQFLFDYCIPPIGITLAAILKPNSENNLSKLKFLDFIIFITIPMAWVYFSRVIAGVLFWSSMSWPGFGAWNYSLVFNSINSMVDYLLFLISVPLICVSLEPLRHKYQSISKQ